ncbi:Nucleoside-diphosphate-sugar epimerase [Amphritea atlantica]|uniref:Nucleoside-diphosphate-sugar epimerase n=1 Tax=Amphritea atlantica TaxID=355243 RepID=A0A1H9EIG6_9GAMM|nr:SDR family oxidoreductase [Amphritea atlantica]SEQ25382.1 Nucleoside-diphosphate-sugar epimerase [Amphritea atlantica]
MKHKLNRHQVLIAGCGDVGSQLGLNLITAGCQVFGLRRNINQLPPGIQGIAADLGQPDTLINLPQQLDTVFYVVAAGARDESVYRQAYSTGLRNLLEALQQQGIHPRQLFFISSTAVYHQQNDEWVDENSATEPDNFSGRIMLEAEQVALNSGIPASVVRFSGIYGPGRNYMLSQVSRGIGYPAEPPRYSNRIHRDDCVGVLQHLWQLSRQQPLRPVYLASDNRPAPLHEVSDWLAQQLGVTITERSARRTIGSKRCRNTLLQQSGYRFRYPDYRAGYPQLIADFLN